MIKLKENIKFNHTIYAADFSTVRIGDLVAASALCSWLRNYSGKRDILFALNIEKYVLPIAKEFEEYVVSNAGSYPYLPVSGNLWAWWDLIYRNGFQFILPNIYTDLVNEKKAVVSPIFDAGYNRDRNWNISLYNDIIELLIQLNYNVTVVLNDINSVLSRPGVKYVYRNLMKSFIEVATAGVFVGGDTGLTHVASVLQGSPKKVIGFYGFFSEWRHKNDCRDSVVDIQKYFQESVECDVSFAPKFAGKDGLYLQMNEACGMKSDAKNKIKEYLCMPSNL